MSMAEPSCRRYSLVWPAPALGHATPKSISSAAAAAAATAEPIRTSRRRPMSSGSTRPLLYFALCFLASCRGFSWRSCPGTGMGSRV
uniref:Uncharacterized protein n=1 Tax=Arundo donax TaxID=35708 RepID=A0A0A9F0K2_ARUDO